MELEGCFKEWKGWPDNATQYEIQNRYGRKHVPENDDTHRIEDPKICMELEGILDSTLLKEEFISTFRRFSSFLYTPIDYIRHITERLKGAQRKIQAEYITQIVQDMQDRTELYYHNAQIITENDMLFNRGILPKETAEEIKEHLKERH